MNTIEWKWPMAEAVDATGEGANGGGAESAAGTATPSEGAGAPSEAGKADEKSTATGDDLKPYGLGTKPEESAADKGADDEGKKDGEEDEAAEDGEKKEVTEADYEKAFVKDEELLGKDEEIVLDKDLAKAVMPTAKELGVSPEAFAKLANALAKAQLDSKNDLTRSRVEYFKQMKTAAMKKYTPKDFERIEAGLTANASGKTTWRKATVRIGRSGWVASSTGPIVLTIRTRKARQNSNLRTLSERSHWGTGRRNSTRIGLKVLRIIVR